MDYAFFLAGLGFLLAALGFWTQARSSTGRFAWGYLGLFALAQGLAEGVLLLGLSWAPAAGLAEAQFALRLVGFAFLVECGRSGMVAGRAPGRWVHLPLLLPALLLALFRFPSAETVLWLTAGVGGGLWAGYALLRHGRAAALGAWISVSGGSLILLALVLLVGSLRGQGPAQTGVLDPLLRAGAAWLLAWSLWRHARSWQGVARGISGEGAEGRPADRSFMLGFALLLLCGWAGVCLVERSAEEEQRESLLGHARIAAASLDLGQVVALRGEPGDLERHAYQALKIHLRRICSASIGHRFFYLLVRKGESAVFLVDSEPEGSEDCSPPGQVYAQASPELLEAFETGLPFVEGPLPDEWGVWVSALVPLQDPVSGKVVALFGLDRDAGAWERSINAHALLAILVVLALVVLLLDSYRGRLRVHADALRIAVSENRYRGLVEGSPNCIQLFDQEGRYVAVNRSGLSGLGLKEEELLGRHFAEIWPEKTRPRILEAIREVLKGAKSEFRSDYFRPDGRVVVWKVVLSPIPTDGGRIGHFVAVGMDVTASTRASQELKESEEKFRSICAAALDGIVMIDPEGRITIWNEAAVLLFGYTPEEAIGKDLHSLIAPERSLPESRLGLARFRETGQGRALGRTMELTARRADGSEFQVEISVSPVQVRDSWHAVGIIRDTTERRRFEADLFRAKEAMEAANAELHQEMERANRMAAQAESANLAKSRFLANMSHEIRTPMNGILGMTRLLIDTGLESEQRDYAEMALKSGQYLLALLNDILDFSKIEAGRLELESLDFDLRSLVQDVVWTQALRAQEKGLELVCLVDRKLPPVLRGDPGRIRQILSNLVGNGVKFSDRGVVALKLEWLGREAGGHRVSLSVQDAGVGISKEDMPRLFKAFSQLDSSMTRKVGGSGLGLSISSNLVKMMGGELTVASVPGQGSTFAFSLALEAPVQACDVLTPEGFSDLGFLVADPSELSRRAFVEMLASWGCEAEEAANWKETLEKVRGHAESPFSIVFLDSRLFDSKFPDLRGSICEEPGLSGARIVLVHEMCRPCDPEALSRGGFDDCLTRPVRQSSLFDTIMGCLESPVSRVAEESQVETRPAAIDSVLRILLAEDNPVNQLVASRLLEKMGHSVRVVSNGREALDSLREEPFDLVFMDIQMPVMDGFEATHEIRLGGFPDSVKAIPVIAMTAHALKGDREKCIAEGMDDYVPKPIDPKSLAAALERWAPRGAEASA